MHATIAQIVLKHVYSHVNVWGYMEILPLSSPSKTDTTITTLQTCQPPKGKKCEILNLELEKVVRNG